MDKVLAYILVLAVATLIAGNIGCASGYEVGGKLGFYAVNERQESQRTYGTQRGLKCLFVDCTQKEDSGS